MIMFLFIGSSVFAVLDLRFTTSITQTPNPVGGEQTVTFSVNWKNFGAAVDNLKVIGGVGQMTLLEKTYAHVDSAEPQKNETFSWTAGQGAVDAWFILDPDKTCGDSNYANNKVWMSVNISGGSAGTPNITVTDCKTEPAKYKSGDTVLFRFTIKNTGTAPSPVPTYAHIEFDNVFQKQILVPAMGPAWANSYTFSYVVKIPSKVAIIVDATSLVAESNENDNKCEKSFKHFFIGTPKAIPKM